MRTAHWAVPSMALAALVCCGGSQRYDPTEHADAAAPAPEDAAIFDVDSYDRSCTFNNECLPVPPVPCDYCVCTDLAVARSEHDSYYKDLRAQRRREGCGHLDYPGLPCATDSNVCRQYSLGVCQTGQCKGQIDRKLDATHYDRTCTADDDCVGVNESLCIGGDYCTSAIAKTAKAQFDADRAAAPPCGVPVPTITPLACGLGVRCEGGQCVQWRDETP